MRLFKKFQQKRRDKKEFLEEYKTYNPLVLEVLEIAKNYEVTIKGLARSYLKDGYEKSENRVSMLRRAPKHVQLKYLTSLNLIPYYHEEIEAFMKLSELVNYNSILFDSDNSDQRALVPEPGGCLLHYERPEKESISEGSMDILLKSTKINKQFYVGHFRVSQYNRLQKTQEETNLLLRADGIEETFDDRINTYLETPDFSPHYSHVLKSFFFILVENYSADYITEIIDKFKDSNQTPTLDQILYFTPKWDELKDYPLDWSLAANLL